MPSIERFKLDTPIRKIAAGLILMSVVLVVDPESELVNHAISQIEVRSNHAFLIVGMKHPDGVYEMNPAPETRLKAGDIVIVLGYQNDIPDLARRFAKGNRVTYRGVTVDQSESS